MRFADIPAHSHAKDLLRGMVNDNRIPHAILIEGQPGIGKLALARAFAQYVHCCNRTPDGDSCGVCPACRQHQSLNNIDTIYIFPVVKLDKMRTAPISDDFLPQWTEFLSNTVFTDFDRWVDMFNKKNAQPATYVTESEALIHKLSLTTQTADYKIVVWWLPERMNEEAANKLLKILEEPFSDTLFVMVSNSPQDILPTIYSRVQRIKLRRLPDSVVAQWLSQHFALDSLDANALAHIADGSMTSAFNLLEHNGDNTLFFETFKSLMRLAYQRKVKELRDWASNLAALGREREIKFYDYLVRQMRENFIYNFRQPDLNYLTRDELQFSANFARFISEVNVEKLISVMEQARTDIAGNGNGKLINFDVAIKVILLIKKAVDS